MRTISLFLLALASSASYADGVMFRDGRFPTGKTTVLSLTTGQKQLIDLYARCKDQNKSPFIFRLTKHQAAQLSREAGLSPRRFQIYDSFKGDDGAEYGYNYIVRFSEESFEVPHKVLISESQLTKWETKVIGWAPSPLARVNPSSYTGASCPQ